VPVDVEDEEGSFFVFGGLRGVGVVSEDVVVEGATREGVVVLVLAVKVKEDGVLDDIVEVFWRLSGRAFRVCAGVASEAEAD
jgi:hypothetical protein